MLEQLVSKSEDYECHVYKRRWYVLGLFCFYSGYQACIWNTFAPITYSVELAYGWSDGTVALLSNWGPIAYVALVIPYTFLFQKLGARYTVLLGTFLVAAGTSLRTFTKEDPPFLILCHLGQLINGASSVIAMSLPGLISALWFPEKERILATSLSQSINILGVALAAGMGPLSVPYDEQYDDIPAPDSVTEDTQDNLHLYLICECVVAVTLFLLTLIYFPPHPPKPPSPTAPHDDHMGFKESWKLILHNKDLWLLCAALAIPGGIQMGWQSVMAIQLEDLGVSDTDVGNIGFASFFGQAAGMAAVGLLMDHFRSKIKLTLLILLTISFVSITWLAMITLEWLPYSLAQLYIAMVFGTSAYLACMPLFFEMSFMICPSAPEDTMGAFLTGTYNVFMLIFLLIMMVPDMDVSWMNYLLIIGNAAAIPLIAMVPKPQDYVSKTP